MPNAPLRSASRRDFLRSNSRILAAGLVSQIGLPAITSGADSSDELKIGLIGCGGRGTGAAADALQADNNVKLTAVGDLFEPRLQRSLVALRRRMPEKVDVAADRCFLGFDAYRKVIDSGVDVVLLTTPPGFRAQHLKAAVEAGKHTIVEITMAIDAPGVRSALESSELAKKKNLGILSGFCWRYNHRHRGALEQIRKGAIGEIRAIYATYLRGSLAHKHPGRRKPEMTDVEWQIRDWYDYSWLSGDVTILLSGGHSVDKMSWWLGNVMPIKAVATGSRVYPGEGNTFDNCFVSYEYANGIRGFLACRSQPGCYNSNNDYIIGTKGICTIGRRPVITGQTNWRYSGEMNNMYQTEHDEFFASIRAGKPINDGTRMAHTTLMAIMGRMA
ncbi:MAG: Gfo/Idh/MocA family oxidoreductase, partial [Planctomycetota bacterium]|nr:Gfo/Idh/MocA family oxidoreductase [Planctomycetota bacterium]